MNVFETVKTSVNTREAAARYGVEVNRHGKALCPFHNDRHPSLFLDDDTTMLRLRRAWERDRSHSQALQSVPVRCGEEAGIRLRHHAGQAAGQGNAGKTE